MKNATVGGILLYWLAVSLARGAEEGTSSGGGSAHLPVKSLEYEEPRYLAGAIYGRGAESNKLLFRFKREATRSGERLDVRRDYLCPDGSLAARERAVYEGNELVSYESEERQIGAQGGARIQRDPDNPAKGSIGFDYAKEAGSKRKTRTEALTENVLITDMIAPFLVAHWDTLLRGEKVKCRCIVVSRRETVGFTFAKESEALWQGRSVVVVEMEATSPFVAALFDPLFLTIEKAPPHHVLEYVGRTTPKIQVGGKWKTLDAVTVFDWETAR